MRSDSVSSFLDLARENRLLEPDQFEELFRQPDVPQSNLSALCEFLLMRKVLTDYQASMIRSGRGYELSFAGYPIYADLGECPGGTAYRVVHPSLRTPLILRRLRADWLAPSDNVAAYVQRAQAACPVVHPNLSHLLDAGVHRDEPFVVLEPTEGADLQSLIADIGPMPVTLAVEYLRQVIRGMEAAHARGEVHGELRPQVLVVGPLVQSSKLRPDGTPRSRPASTATVRVTELGLIPHRPANWNYPEDVRPYLPPERANESTATQAGDVYMLAGCLQYLLTGRAPSATPLITLRPDLPTPISVLHAEMTATDPAARPTMSTVLARLEEFAAPKPKSAPNVETVPVSGNSSILSGTAMDQAKGVAIVDVELVHGDSGVQLDTLPAPSPSEPISLSSSIEVPKPTVAAGGWDAYAGGTDPEGPNLPAMVGGGGAVEWSPQPFVPSELHESRSEPGYDPTEDGVSMRRTPRPPAPGAKKQLWMWLGIGLTLQVVAVILWVILFSNSSEPDPEPRPKPKATKKK